ncbi:MAG: YceI family protein [Bacteroidia bacterium]
MNVKTNRFFLSVFILVLSTLVYSFKTINTTPTSWEVTSSSVLFKIKNAKLNVTGNFTDVNTKITFDPAVLNKSHFDGVINVISIKTGIDLRDKHLKKQEFFDAAKHPQILFKSTSIKQESEGNYTAVCQLTIKGKTKEVLFPFKFSKINNQAAFTGTLKLNRLDFGVGLPSVVMANNVDVSIILNTTKAK